MMDVAPNNGVADRGLHSCGWKDLLCGCSCASGVPQLRVYHGGLNNSWPMLWSYIHFPNMAIVSYASNNNYAYITKVQELDVGSRFLVLGIMCGCAKLGELHGSRPGSLESNVINQQRPM